MTAGRRNSGLQLHRRWSSARLTGINSGSNSSSSSSSSSSSTSSSSASCERRCTCHPLPELTLDAGFPLLAAVLSASTTPELALAGRLPFPRPSASTPPELTLDAAAAGRHCRWLASGDRWKYGDRWRGSEMATEQDERYENETRHGDMCGWNARISYYVSCIF